MKNKILSILFLLLSGYCLAQKVKEPVNCLNILKQANDLEKDEKYQEAITELEKITRNDTSYASALLMRASVYSKLKEYDKSVLLCREGARLQSEEKINFIINQAFYLNQLEKYEEAIAVIDEAQKTYPYNHLLFYNKGTSLKGLKKYQEALEVYKELIKANPYYSYGHYQLGMLAAAEGDISKAMMALNMFLILSPQGESSLFVLDKLNTMVAAPFNGTTNNIKLSPEGGDDFTEINLIINNYVALRSDYKIPVKTATAIIKQNYALLNALQYNKDDKGFWMQTYVPFFKQLIKDDKFQGFSYYILQASKNDTHIKLVSKNKSSIDEFISWAVPNLNKIQSLRKTVLNGKPGEYDFYYDNKSHNISAVGKFNKQINNFTGYFEYYDSDGCLTAKGVLNENGEKDGLWHFFNSDGSLNEKTNYVKGKAEGIVTWFYQDSTLSGEKSFADGSGNGSHKRYNSSGLLIKNTNYKDGVEEGKFTIYYDLGEKFKHFEGKYIQGKLQDTLYEYYDNGSLASFALIKDGLRSGDEKNFYRNGNLKAEFANLNGSKEGEYKRYHPNGKLMEYGKFKEGKQIGAWKEYYSNGELESEMILDDKGKVNGILKKYDNDGKIHYEYEYLNAELVAYKYFDKSGAIVKEDRKKKGEFEFTGYYPEGMKNSEGIYTANGKVGLWKFYDKFGILYLEENYNTKGQMHGKEIYYYPNGKISSTSQYENGQEEGAYISYHLNGKIKTEGWMKNGQKEGYWYNYYIDGVPESKTFFREGSLTGHQQYFSVTGKLKKEEQYSDEGLQIRETEYDSLGTILNDIILKNGTGDFIEHFTNKKIRFKGHYIAGLAHGKFEWYHFNGKLATTGSFYNGNRHSSWKWYDEDGTMTTEGEYSYGDKIGKWNNYHPNKKLSRVLNYENGELEGKEMQYFENGNIEISRNYSNGELEGDATYYDEFGEIQMIRKYHNGKAISATYYNKEGSLSPAVNLLSPASYTFTAYYKNGNKSREYSISNGLFQNTYTEYYSNGKIESESVYNLDEIDGVHKEFYFNGILKAEENYILGEQNGLSSYYFPNGKIKSTVSYRSGLKHGLCKHYSSEGKLLKTQVYYSDILIKEETH